MGNQEKITNSNSLANQSDVSSKVLFFLAIVVLLLHCLVFLAFQYSEQPPQQAASELKPFKLEVSMLSSPETKASNPANSQPAKPQDKPQPKKSPEKKPPDKPKPEDAAAIEQLINTQPRREVAKAVRIQPETRSVQSVSSSIIRSRPKTPHAIDNFPESDQHNPSPEYPDMAIFLGYQGAAIVKINVTAKGTSSGVELLRSSGHKVLDESAAKTLKQWKFTPTNKPDSIIIVVNFAMH